METYEQIIAEITDKIKTNGNKEITGAILQGVLLGIIAAVRANQQDKLEYYSENQDGSIVDADLVVNGNVDATNKLGCLRLSVEDIAILNGTLEVYGLLTANRGIVLNDGNNHEYIITVDAGGNIVSTPKNS